MTNDKKAYNRQYYQLNRLRFLSKRKEYYEQNREQILATPLSVATLEQRKRYRDANKVAISNRNSAYHQNNTNRVAEYHKLYRQKSLPKIAAAQRLRYSTDLDYRLRCNIRSRIYDALSRGQAYKSNSSINLLGCSIAEVKQYIRAKFVKGMSWNNRGNGPNQWNIDHIRPCASFDLTDPEQQKACFHYTNLQPLWATENFQKKDKWNEN